MIRWKGQCWLCNGYSITTTQTRTYTMTRILYLVVCLSVHLCLLYKHMKELKFWSRLWRYTLQLYQCCKDGTHKQESNWSGSGSSWGQWRCGRWSGNISRTTRAPAHVFLSVLLPQPVIQGSEVVDERLGRHHPLACDCLHCVWPWLGGT